MKIRQVGKLEGLELTMGWNFVLKSLKVFVKRKVLLDIRLLQALLNKMGLQKGLTGLY